MAEITFVRCPKRDDQPHCWHTHWITYAVWREAVTSSDGEVCCWCDEKRPMQPTYTVPLIHGPFKQGGFP